jgi:microcystin-dependent protein
MSDPFIAEIIMFGGNFAPNGWAFCDGQVLAISQNNALFALIGTTYGGDGRTTVQLPDLRGRVPMHWGTGPGRTPRNIGATGGVESVVLNTGNMPSHVHGVAVPVENSEGQSASPAGNFPAAGEEPTKPYAASSSSTLGSFNSAPVGGSTSHENMPPFQCVSFIIAMVGVFPSRS